MTEQTMTQTNSDGDLLTWWHSSKVETSYDEDEDRQDSTQECATCEQAIERGQAYWHCIDNAEEIHEGCGLPAW